ncbi:MAG: hypothetical protein WCG91_01630 [Candidatus Shapirobacteria bacterium]
MKTLIVHKATVDDDLRQYKSPRHRFDDEEGISFVKHCEGVQQEINDVIDNATLVTEIEKHPIGMVPNADVFLLTDVNFERVREIVTPGESIRVVGAYTELCVEAAIKQVQEAGGVPISTETDSAPCFMKTFTEMKAHRR